MAFVSEMVYSGLPDPQKPLTPAQAARIVAMADRLSVQTMTPHTALMEGWMCAEYEPGEATLLAVVAGRGYAVVYRREDELPQAYVDDVGLWMYLRACMHVPPA